MKPLAWMLVVAVGLGAGYCWHRQSVRAAVQMAQTEASRDSLRLAERADSAVRVTRDSLTAAWAADTLRQVRQLGSLRRQLTDWRDSAAVLDSAYQQALATLPDSARAPIAASVRALTFRVVTCETALTVTDSLYRGCAARLAAADSSIAGLQALQRRTAELADQYRRAARPSWLKQVANALPWMAGAFATGVVVTLIAR